MPSRGPSTICWLWVRASESPRAWRSWGKPCNYLSYVVTGVGISAGGPSQVVLPQLPHRWDWLPQALPLRKLRQSCYLNQSITCRQISAAAYDVNRPPSRFGSSFQDLNFYVQYANNTNNNITLDLENLDSQVYKLISCGNAQNPSFLISLLYLGIS